MRPFNLNSNLKKNNKLLLKQKPLQDDQHDNTGANNGPKESNILAKSDNDDLVNLNNLNEATVLEQLKERYSKNKIYTFIGDILIAMNPLKAIPIYGKSISNQYQKTENIRANLPPHVFAIAEQCYREMMRTRQSQCILISGESGSGKTETCKYLVQHLLNRTKPFEHCLNSKIQEVNPLLEAFGNAQTRINDNSSRFGKYLEIYFEQDGTVVGAKFKEYLLEKSRVVYQNVYESTFHIFYLLFAGLTVDEKLRYHLVKSPDQYRFMSNTNLENCMSFENEEKFNAIRESMNTIGFSSEDIESLIKILISILLIGDISFVQRKSSNNDGVQVRNMELIEKICDLIELDSIEFSDALVSEVQITRGEEIKRERNMVQACDVRDAFAKALYGRLFSWIVNQINHHIQPAEGVSSSFSIGLLDIFGFENFERNSFEQMCINLANEQIHQLFTKYIFKLEIQECLDEGIEMNNSDLVNYQDNQNILDLFLEKRLGIFALLDEESRFPKATDQSLAIKLHNSLSATYSDVYIAPKNVGTSFQICHYAGQVLYSVDGFLEKNRDFLPNNLFYVSRNSNDFLVQELFQCKLTRKGTLAPSDRQSRLRKSISINSYNPDQDPDNITLYSTNEEIVQPHYPHKVRFAASTITSSLSSMNSYQNSLTKNIKILNRMEDNKASINSFVNQYASDKAPLTVACHFKNSLHELIEKINKCKAYFIRCIKPNPNQQSIFINEFVTKQLRYCSIMHVCKIRKCGYPYRIEFDEFLKWYKAIEVCILKPTDRTHKSRDLNNNVNEPLERCLKCLGYAKITNYKVGKSKLFLRYWHIDILNSLAKKLEKNIIIAQKVTRGWLVRNRIKKMQQQETSKFLAQVANISNNILAKLVHQKNYLLLANQIKNENQKKSIERFSQKESSFGSTMSKSSWPDINEINSTLEEFDLMLNEYEFQNEKIEITKANAHHYNKPSFVSKVSPESVYHLVHNKNNKNDNTLKKRNALVTFEFKTLLDKVIPAHNNSNSYSDGQSEDEKLNNEILDLLPATSPYIYNDSNNFNINIPNTSTHSPPSFSSSSTSSSSSANNSSSSSSTSSSSSQQIDNNENNFRTVSPSQLMHISSSRVDSPPPSSYLSSKSQVISSSPLDNKRFNAFTKLTPEQSNNKKIFSTRKFDSNANRQPVTNNSNITIWREELNAKKNFQQQLQKQTELAKGIEDSRKNIPEWKKNLLKQKEMKKTIAQTTGSNSNLNNHSETPELMKHNIFVKKVLATKI